MFDTHAIQDTFGRAARAYDAHALLQQRVRTYQLGLARSRWPAGAFILDAGCGTGAFAGEARAHRWRMAGLDLALGMCEAARRRGEMVTNGDACALPFADASFDGVFSSLMLQWVNTPQRAWQEMARVLKAGGTVILATLLEGTLHELRQSFAGLDDASHVSTFAPTHVVLEESAHAGLSLVSARQAKLIEYYPDAIALMRALQAIGASNKQVERPRGLMTPARLARVEQAYERFRCAQGLPATWQVLSLVVRKA